MKLQHKIPLFVVAVMLIVGMSGAWLILAAQKEASVRQFEETATAISTTIISGLEEDMIGEDADQIQQTLDRLHESDSVRDVDIIAADGTVWASTDTGSIGDTVDDSFTGVLRGEGDSKVFGDPSDEFMISTEVIPAKEDCLACHDGVTAVMPDDRGNLGLIRTDISTRSLNEGLNLGRTLMLAVFGTIFLVVAVTIVTLMRRSVLNPLSRLESAADAISRGDYSVRAEVDESNEIGAVGESFNQMVERVEKRTRELVATNTELEESNRLKSEFLANMSHELRTPLNVIIGFSEVLRDTPPGELPEDEHKEFCENIITSGYHLLELINDVLDLAKVEAGRMEIESEEFYLAPVLKDVITTMQPLASKKGIDLNADVSANVSSVYADPNRFRQVMYNLLSNAVKFTPEDGVITVSAALIGNNVRFSVSDTGIGISPADQDNIFSEFTQVDGSWSRQFEGTGLGLSLSRKFIELMKGQIWVESELGLGSTFFFTLPVPLDATLPDAAPAERELDVGAPAEEADRALPDESRRDMKEDELPLVLVVEDDQRTAELIGLWLTHDGYRVEYALDGEEAVKKAKAETPFAVCLDIMLPKRDGWQVLHELKSNPATADSGVIICSALDNPGLGFALGAADYCVKPLSRRHLLDKLKTIQDSVTFRRSKPQVIVADADDDSAGTTILALERQGFNILRTTDSEQTKAVALEHNPDVIIIDQMLPGSGCYEVVSYLQDHPVTVDIPVIVASNRDLSDDEKQRLGSHVQRVIRVDDSRDQLLGEMFRLEKLQPDRAQLVDRQTRLFNRRYYEKRLAEELNRTRRYMLDLSTLLISIDQRTSDAAEQLQMVNALAGLLRSNVRAADPLSRYDANRFAVLLPETGANAGYQVARKIVDLVRKADFTYKGLPLNMTASVAVLGFTGDEAPAVDEVISRLEAAQLELSERGGDAIQLS